MTDGGPDTIAGAVPPAPRANPHLLGHGAAEKELLEAFRGGRLAHAWLITGPRGIGKATLAYRFARYVLAHGDEGEAGAGGGLFGPDDGGAGGTLEVSPDDPVFRRVAAGSHSDMMAVERAWADDKQTRRYTVIRVEDVRQVGSFLRMTPAEGGWRVVVVDCADDMNLNAANALLKVLEEPPARSLMLLVSHSPGRLLPTIRSRCRRLPLRPLDEASMRALLQRYAPDLGADETTPLLTLADGSIGRALDLAAEGGLDVFGTILELLGSRPVAEPVALHQFGDRLTRKGAEGAFRTAREALTWLLSRVVRVAAAGERGSSGPVPEAAAPVIARLAAAGTLDRWLEVWEKCGRLLDRAEGANLDRKQVILNVFHLVGEAADG